MKNNKLDKYFYLGLIISTLMTLIPLKYILVLYGLSYLGWFYAIIVIITLLLFFILLILDLKYKHFKKLLIRTLILVMCIFIFKQMSSCQTKVYEEYVDEILQQK